MNDEIRKTKFASHMTTRNFAKLFFFEWRAVGSLTSRMEPIDLMRRLRDIFVFCSLMSAIVLAVLWLRSYWNYQYIQREGLYFRAAQNKMRQEINALIW